MNRKWLYLIKSRPDSGEEKNEFNSKQLIDSATKEAVG